VRARRPPIVGQRANDHTGGGLKGVFDTKSNSGYDDEITHRYHFPSQYRSTAAELVGNWIVYREPQRNGGRRAYVATARVLRIEPDPKRAGHAYAVIGDYLSFDRPVPFSSGGTYAEASLRAIDDPSKVGAYLQGKSVRPLSDADFAAIVRAGLGETLAPQNAVSLKLDPEHADQETLSLIRAPIVEQERRVEQILVNRKIREANFRRQVCEAYENRCAVTGLCIVNGGGRAEVQAAHILAVAEGGLDIVQNGIALLGTAHWLFDRHLISLTDDYRLLVSHNKVPPEIRRLFDKQLERIHLPNNSVCGRIPLTSPDIDSPSPRPNDGPDFTPTKVVDYVPGPSPEHGTRDFGAKGGTRTRVALSTSSKRSTWKSRSNFSQVRSRVVRAWMFLAPPRSMQASVDAKIPNSLLGKKI
jgi:putative restriction endonuclease